VDTVTKSLSGASSVVGKAQALANSTQLMSGFVLASMIPGLENMHVSGAVATALIGRATTLTTVLRAQLKLLSEELKRAKRPGYRRPSGAGAELGYLGPLQLPSVGYKKVPNGRAPSAPPVKAGKNVSRRAASTATALNSSFRRIIGFVGGFSEAIDRAYKAFQAKDGKYGRLQTRAAARLATKAAKELDALPAIAARFSAAFQRKVPRSDMLRLRQQFKTFGFTPQLARVLKRLRVSATEIAELQRRIGTGPVPASFPLFDAKSRRAIRLLATSFRSYGKLLAVA
jgi:hypothetical protein